MQLYTRILLGMVVGVVAGLVLGPHPVLIAATEWIGRLFLGAIRMVVVPLVFCSLTVGVASLGDLRRLGRIGGRTLLYFLATVVVAVTLGLVLGNVFRPGDVLGDADRAKLLATYGGAAAAVGQGAAPSFVDQLVGLVPVNPVASLADGNMLQIIVFAVLLGAALTVVPPARSRPVLAVLEGVNDAMVVLVGLAMTLAPFGVAAILFQVVGTTGFSVLVALSAFSAIVLLGLLVHVFVVCAAVVRFGARLPFVAFLRTLRPVLLVAFGTSSSAATLPVALRAVEADLGVSREVTSFVLPLGASVSRGGTALYQGVTAVFVAQIYGVHLSVADEIGIVAMATLASLSSAGVPGSSMITLTMVLTAIGAPVEGIALVLGVDRLLDMFRTTVNVLGNCVGAALVARLEGESLRVA